MKRELWPKVKVGTWVIYADEDLGVHKAKVTEIDVKIYEPGEPSRWGYPYGKTKDTGTVRIRYDETELIHNLADLISYGPAKYAKLRKDWQKLAASKAETEMIRETFRARILEYRTY